MTGTDGGLYTFGDAPYLGNCYMYNGGSNAWNRGATRALSWVSWSPTISARTVSAETAAESGKLGLEALVGGFGVGQVGAQRRCSDLSVGGQRGAFALRDDRGLSFGFGS